MTYFLAQTLTPEQGAAVNMTAAAVGVQWANAIAAILGSIAWPALLLALVIVFRREIRQRLSTLTQVTYPGGSITLGEVERLETRVGKLSDQHPDGLSPPPPVDIPLQPGDSRLSIAQMRLDVERELFRMSQVGLGDRGITSWTVSRHIFALERSKLLAPELAEGIRDFIALTEKIISDPRVSEDVVRRCTTIGGSLHAQLRRKRCVLEAERDFEGHGLWHISTQHMTDFAERKYHYWSGLAAEMPLFAYDYEVYSEAAQNFNRKMSEKAWAKDFALAIVPLHDFVRLLEFREGELLRLIESWGGNGVAFEKANEWRWPPEWGTITWNGPILRDRLSLWAAERDLMETRSALERYRRQLEQRAAENRPTVQQSEPMAVLGS